MEQKLEKNFKNRDDKLILNIKGEWGPELIKNKMLYALSILKNRNISGTNQQPKHILTLLEEI